MKKEKEVKVDIELSDKTYKKLCILAKKYNVTLNDMMLMIIRNYLREAK